MAKVLGKGLEAIIARNISLNSHGSEHPMYLNKPKNFDAFCWHYDEIETFPDNCNILSFNDRSTIQSLSFLRNNAVGIYILKISNGDYLCLK